MISLPILATFSGDAVDNPDKAEQAYSANSLAALASNEKYFGTRVTATTNIVAGFMPTTSNSDPLGVSLWNEL